MLPLRWRGAFVSRQSGQPPSGVELGFFSSLASCFDCTDSVWRYFLGERIPSSKARTQAYNHVGIFSFGNVLVIVVVHANCIQ